MTDMIMPTHRVRILVATQPVDFRKGHDGLAALVQSALKENPFTGTVFVFRAKRAERLKILFWDGTGLVMAYKRLEEATFTWPAIKDERRNELAFVTLVLGRAFPGTNQVAHRLMRFIRNPDRCQFPSTQEPSQSNCIQPVCLYALSGTHRNQRGRDNTAFETERSHLPIKAVSGRSRFIAY